ncbi:hypothetical protein AAHB49_00925 [Bacillus cereus]
MVPLRLQMGLACKWGSPLHADANPQYGTGKGATIKFRLVKANNQWGMKKTLTN